MKNEQTISQEDKDLISYLRGFAILSIVFGHVGGYWVLQPYSSYLHACGSTFFFFLSGAVLYHSFKRSGSTRSFYLKRYTNLLLPYYLTCLLALLVYLYNQKAFPEFAADKFLLWIAIAPKEEFMPFPLGQLWFLFTYVILLLFCPLYVRFFEHKKKLFYVILLCFVLLSAVKFMALIESFLLLKLYKYCFFSIFFMTGIFSFAHEEKHLKAILVTMFLTSVTCLTVYGLQKMSLPDISKNFLRMDLISVMATTILASSVVLLKNQMYKIISFPPLLPSILKFFHRHTFSVYLLHSLCIYLAERYFGLVDPEQKDAAYGIVKLAVVLLLTSLLAAPFTRLSKSLSNIIISTVSREKARGAGTRCEAGIDKV